MTAPLGQLAAGLLPPVPRMKWRPEVPQDTVLAQPCETCSATAGQPCHPGVCSLFVLGYYMATMDGLHAARYRAAVNTRRRPAH